MNTKPQARLLLLGPLPKPKIGRTGGARVSFRALLSYFKRKGHAQTYLDIRPSESGAGLLLNPWQLLWQVWQRRAHFDTLWLNASYRGLQYLGPLLYVFAKLWRKTMVVRPFGSAWYTRYQQADSFSRWLFARTVLRADVLLLQTHAMLARFTKRVGTTAHLPTTRPQPPIELINRRTQFRGRLVYLGHIKASKGIDELLAVAKQLPPDWVLHLYGPIKASKYAELGQQSVHYQGMLEPSQVLSTLAAYDVLILPTYFPGEGYPGVIVEAFSLGIPVITTHWLDIPEMIQDGTNGLLVEPRASAALLSAIQSLAQVDYQAMSAAARHTFETHYCEDHILPKIEDMLNSIT